MVELWFYLGVAGTRCNSIFSSPEMSYSKFGFKMKSNFQEVTFPPYFPVVLSQKWDQRSLCPETRNLPNFPLQFFTAKMPFYLFPGDSKVSVSSRHPFWGRLVHNPFLLSVTACHNSKQDSSQWVEDSTRASLCSPSQCALKEEGWFTRVVVWLCFFSKVFSVLYETSCFSFLVWITLFLSKMNRTSEGKMGNYTVL